MEDHASIYIVYIVNYSLCGPNHRFWSALAHRLFMETQGEARQTKNSAVGRCPARASSRRSLSVPGRFAGLIGEGTARAEELKA